MAKDTTERLTLSGLRDIINERDKRYNVLFDAQKEALATAISSINKQTEAAFRAAQTAIDKSEAAQKQYNEEHNNLSRRMVALDKYESDRQNIEEKFDDIKKSVSAIEVSLGVGTGEKSQSKSDKVSGQWIIVTVISFIAVASNVVMFLIVHGK